MLISNAIRRTIDLIKTTSNSTEKDNNNKDVTKTTEQSSNVNFGRSNSLVGLLENTLNNTAINNKTLVSTSKTKNSNSGSKLLSIGSILSGSVPSSSTLSSFGLFNSLSDTSLSIALSVLGFDTKNLDLSNIKEVDFVGYFGKIIGKSTPDIIQSLLSTTIKDLTNFRNDDFVGDLTKTLLNSVLGSESPSMNTDGMEGNPWTFDVVKSIISSKSVEEQQHILDSIAEQAPYLMNEEYKKDASSPSTLSNDIVKSGKLCVAAGMNDNIGVEGALNQAPWEIADTTYNTETGYWGRTYVNSETHEIILTNLGTNSSEDAVTDDVDMMQGKIPDQYEDAVAYALKILSDPQYEGYNVTISGHSLGGSLTEFVACTQEVRDAATANGINLSAISLNGYGISNVVKNNSDGYLSKDGTTKYNFVDKEDADQITMYNFITEDDLVCCSTKHYGNTILFDNNNKLVPHMLNSIEEQLNALDSNSSAQKNKYAMNFRFPFSRV